jgi:multiphosphoryl transfer protein
LLSPAGVLVAADLTPTQAARLDPSEVLGIVTAAGSPLSHAAILARSLGIPAVVGAGDEVLAIPDGTAILVDGTEGVFVIDPDAKVTAQYRDRAAQHRQRVDFLLEASSRSAITSDGISVEVVANIASLDDALQAVRQGADGVGLLRTEFLFLDRPDPPGEDEQYGVYLAIAEALEGRPLTVRTLDVGGDKPVPYLPAATEANPFLGRRGLRLSLHQPDIFKQQLRALVRTAVGHPITVLFPMVTTLDELRSARALLVEAAGEVGCAAGGLPLGLKVGAMAEVPAFALHARAAAPLVDLISIGTNDLSQYTLAAERGNAAVAALADPLDPAVLFLISEVANAATARTRVAVCGEIASDPTAAALLIGLGVRELSMTPRAVPAVKDAIRSLSANKAKQLAALALHRDSAASVRALLGDLA